MKKLADEAITEDMPLSMRLEIARAKLLARVRLKAPGEVQRDRAVRKPGERP